MIWIPTAIAILALLRCFVLEKRIRRLKRRNARQRLMLEGYVEKSLASGSGR